MSKKRIISLVLACILLLLITLSIVFFEQIATWIVDRYITRLEQCAEYPDSGQYYCTELNATIEFSKQVPVFYLAGQEYELYTLGYDATFNGTIGNNAMVICRMPYFWDRKADEIQITITKFPVNYEEGKTYHFVKAE